MDIVLVEPQIPQNTGNIGRTCLALDARLWLVQPLAFRLDEKRLKRSGLDYWDHVQVTVVDDWTDLLRRLPAAAVPWLLTKSGRHDLFETSLGSDPVLVFGSETAGLPSSLLESHPQRTLRIPMSDPVRSLNLSNAVAVVAYEAYRQSTVQ